MSGAQGRLRARPFARARVGEGRDLIHATAHEVERAQIVDRDVADALAGCDAFRTLDEHAALAAGRLGGEASELRVALGELAEAGFLLSRAQLIERARDHERSPTTRIGCVAVPSRNRAESTARALQSFQRNAQAFGRSVDLLVMDDSSAEDVKAEYVARLGALAPSSGQRVLYGGLAEKRRFLDALAADGGPAESARFALSTVPGVAACPGANRNAITLATLDQTILSVDDDIVCAPAPSPKLEPGVRVFSGRGRGYENYNPAEFWFFRDREATLRAVEPTSVDVLALNERMLGRSLASCVADGEGSIDLEPAMDEDMLERIERGTGSVAVTFLGTYGDVGWYTPTWYTLLEGPSRRRLMQEPDDYVNACERSREVLRVVSRPTLNDGRYCQSAVIGLDVRDSIPPFIPMGRYEDGVFRMLLRSCAPDRYFAYIPYALLHDPLETRGFRRADIWKTATWVRTGELLVQCILAHAPTSRRYGDRLRSLGAFLGELGELSSEDLRAFLRRRFWEQKGRYLGHLESLLSRYGRSPEPWARDLSLHVENGWRSLTRPDYVVPRELALAAGGAEEGLRRCQALLRGMGRLLREWEELLEATRSLRERGITPYRVLRG